MIKKYSLLFGAFLFYSLAVVFGKIASGNPAFSLLFTVFYALQIISLGIYAVLWQFSLKHCKLSVAYPLKSITIIIGMCFGACLFSETISMIQILAVFLIFAGVYLVRDYE